MKTKCGRRRFFRCFSAHNDVDGDATVDIKCKNDFSTDNEGGDSSDTAGFNHDWGSERTVPSTSLLDGGCGKKRRRRRPHLSFYRVLKQMLGASSLLQKKFGTKSTKANENSSCSKESSNGDELTGWRNSSSVSSSLNTSSAVNLDLSSLEASSTSSCASTSRSASERKSSCSIADLKTQLLNDSPSKNKASGCCFASELGIFFLVVGLLVLLIWGRAFAILGTSLCLFLAPPRRLRVLYNPVMDIDLTQDSKNESSCKAYCWAGVVLLWCNSL